MKEYVIWGKTKKSDNPLDEQLLVSEKAGIKSLSHAKSVVKLLEEKHGCHECRIQVLDLSEPFTWEPETLLN